MLVLRASSNACCVSVLQYSSFIKTLAESRQKGRGMPTFWGTCVALGLALDAHCWDPFSHSIWPFSFLSLQLCLCAWPFSLHWPKKLTMDSGWHTNNRKRNGRGRCNNGSQLRHSFQTDCVKTFKMNATPTLYYLVPCCVIMPAG